MAILNSTKVNGQLEADSLNLQAASGEQALFVSGNATIKGNLEVDGDLVYVGTQNLRVNDKVVELAYSDNETTAAEADGAGIVIGKEGAPIASIKYKYSDGADGDRIVVDKKIEGEIENADHASKAAQLDNALVFGNGLVVSEGTSFDGSKNVEISVDSDFKVDNAVHADAAGKVDHTLTIKGDGVEEVVFDGSEDKELVINLDNYQTVAAAESASAAQAEINKTLQDNIDAANDHADELHASASAALSDYSSSQATVNSDLSASVVTAKEELTKLANDNFASASAALSDYSSSQATVNGSLQSNIEAAQSASIAHADDKFNEASESLASYSGSQAQANSELSASVAAAKEEVTKLANDNFASASAALSSFSSSQATTNSELSASVVSAQSASIAHADDKFNEASASMATYITSQSTYITNITNELKQEITSSAASGSSDLEDYKAEISGTIAHVEASSSLWDSSLQSSKDYSNEVSASLRTDFANSISGSEATLRAEMASSSAADQDYADSQSEAAAVRAIASSSAAINALNFSSSVVVNEYVSAVNEEAGVISIEKASIPVIGVVSEDKIIKISNRELQSELSIEYNSEDRHVYLKGIDGVEVSKFDASAFIKDGILYGTALIEASAESQEVTIKEQSKEISGLVAGKAYMIFCFSNGAAVDTEYSWEVLDVTELVDVYTGGNGISIDSNVVAVKLAEGTNYAKIKNGALAVDSINAQHTMLSGSIQVAGGPLADDITNDWPTDWKDEAGNKIIPSDLSLHQVLEGLFLKVINGTVTKKAASSWNPANTAPTATISSANVPVGSMVTVSFAANQGVTGNSRSIEVSASQGHFLNDGTSWISGSYKQSKTGSVSGTAVVSATFSGSAVSSGDEVRVNPGTSSLVVNQSGITASIAKFDDATIYASTNTRVKLAASASIHEDAAPTDKPLTNSKTASVVGYFPIYNGQLADTNMSDASWTEEKIKSGNVTASSVPTQVEITSGKATYFIAIPEGHANYSKTVLNVEATSDKSPFGKGKVTSAIAVPMLNGWGNKNYKVFYISNASAQSANNTFNITFA